MQKRLMVILTAAWARGDAKCTQYLLEAFNALNLGPVAIHVILTHDLPLEMGTHLIPQFEKVAKTSWEIEVPDTIDRLRRRIEEFQPHILLHTFRRYVVEAVQNCRIRPKIVLVLHGIADNDFDPYDKLETDMVVCVSQCAAEIAIQRGIPRYKIKTIANGVPQMVGVDRSVEWGIPENSWVWCFVGGLSALKRPQLLLESLARRGREDEYVVLAGPEDWDLAIRDWRNQGGGLIDKLGIAERCVFLGHTDDIGDVYETSNALVIPSQRESMPLTMLEAMSVGRGVVANNVGGIPEVLNRHYHGVLCNAGDPNSLDAALDEFRSRDQDRIRASARQHWEAQYTHLRMARDYEDAFSEIMWS